MAVKKKKTGTARSIPAAPAKVLRPRLASAHARTRLFRTLDRARARALVWIGAPPGAGKTTLVTTYLEARKLPCLWYQVDAGDADPANFFHYFALAVRHSAPRGRGERLPGLTPLADPLVFSRRYFEALGASLRTPLALVFDNYQELPADSPVHAILREGLLALPGNVLTIFVSRGDPPPVLARQRANAGMTVIDAGALALTGKESLAIARLRKSTLDRKAVERLTALAGGWTAGLMLLLESEPEGRAQLPSDDKPTQAVFDYFAAEIFERLDAETRTILLESAFLPKMKLRHVERLTGNPEAGVVLARLHQRSYFTVRHVQSELSYEYHPLFRSFLLAQARASLPSGRLTQIQCDAARLLEADGDVEDAVALLDAAGDHQSLSRLIERHAPVFLQQSRGQTVEAWLGRLPAGVLHEAPWLLYWSGVARFSHDVVAARQNYEQAYSLFDRANDATGLFLSWAAIVDSYFYQWQFRPLDRWIETLAQLQARFPEFPSAAVRAQVACGAFLALLYRQPHNPDLRVWEQEVLRLALSGTDTSLQAKIGPHLILYYTWWTGDRARAETLVQTLRPLMVEESVSPLIRITWHAMAAAYHWKVAETAAAQAAADAGLALSAATGVHMCDYLLCAQAIFACLSENDVARAEYYLRRMQQPGNGGWTAEMEKAMYYYLSAWANRLQGRKAIALEQARAAVFLSEESGNRFMITAVRVGHALTLFASGDREAACEAVRLSRDEGRAMNARNIEYLTQLACAEFALERGDDAECLAALRTALAIASSQGFICHAWAHPDVMARLYSRALEAGIELDYVRQVIRTRALPPPQDTIHVVDAWPWEIRIRTLGRFAVERDDALISFSGSAGRKPMALLAALIAYGGRDVSQDALSEALWPDAEGDAARRVFDTTLHRLRKQLGNDAIILKEGRLSLSARHCWVDCLALEKLLDDLPISSASTDEQMEKLASRTLALYQGPFLSLFSDEAWVLPARERLRSKLLRQLASLIRRLEVAGRYQKAADICQRALEAEPLGEEFYRGLMRVQLAQQQRAEALSTYQRCRHVLATLLGIEPSAETRALARDLASARQKTA